MDDEKTGDTPINHAAFEIGVRSIAGYARRDFKVRSDRPATEQEFHFERAMAATAAELILQHLENDEALSHYLAGRAVSEPFVPRVQVGPVERHGAPAAQEIVRLLARKAMVDSGYFGEWDDDEDLPAWLKAEAAFCADDARFVPIHS